MNNDGSNDDDDEEEEVENDDDEFEEYERHYLFDVCNSDGEELEEEDWYATEDEADEVKKKDPDGFTGYDATKSALRELCKRLYRNDPSLTSFDLTTGDIEISDVEEYSSYHVQNDPREARALNLCAALRDNTVVTSIKGLCIEVYVRWGLDGLGFACHLFLQHFFRKSNTLRELYVVGFDGYEYDDEGTLADTVDGSLRAISKNSNIQVFSMLDGVRARASAVAHLLRTSPSIHTFQIELWDELVESQANPNVLADAFGANQTLTSLMLQSRHNTQEAVSLILPRLAAHPRLRHLSLKFYGEFPCNGVIDLLINSSTIRELDLSPGNRADNAQYPSFITTFCKEFVRHAATIKLSCLRLDRVTSADDSAALMELLTHTVHLREFHVLEDVAECRSLAWIKALRRNSSLYTVTIPANCTFTTRLPDTEARKLVDAYGQRNRYLNDLLIQQPSVVPSTSSTDGTTTEETPEPDSRVDTATKRPTACPPLFVCAHPMIQTAPKSIVCGLLGLRQSIGDHAHAKRSGQSLDDGK